MASSSTLVRSTPRALRQSAYNASALRCEIRALRTTAHASASASTSQSAQSPGTGTATTNAAPSTKEKIEAAAPVDPISRLDPQSPSTATSLSPSPPPAKAHRPLKMRLVAGIARLLGYNATTTTAIRVTSELYDACAAQAEEQADFFYKTCQLPPTYQTWFQITTLHIHLFLTRFRALETPAKAHAYSQELINHFFIDAESRMRMRFGVQTSRLVKGYMREMHTQQRGAILGLDEALSYSVARELDRERFDDADAALATALWRNLWGAGGWGKGVGGVKRKLKGIDRESDEEKKARLLAEKEGRTLANADMDKPELARDLGAAMTGRGEKNAAAASALARTSSAASIADLEHNDTTPGNDLDFALALERLVAYYRRETARLAELSNGDIEKGRIGAIRGRTMQERMEELQTMPRVSEFGRA